MAGFSNYLEDKLINHVLRNTSYTPATAVYLALFTSNPTDADTGSEVSGGSYARQSVAFSASSSGSSSNSSSVSFASMPAATITHVGVYDLSSGGNLLFHGALSASTAVASGDTFTIQANDLQISLA